MFSLVSFWVSFQMSSEMTDTLTNKGLHRCDLVKKCLSETNLGLFAPLVPAYLILSETTKK